MSDDELVDDRRFPNYCDFPKGACEHLSALYTPPNICLVIISCFKQKLIV